ncbi:MAG TPA: glycosyltransferase [Gemmatimonadales bacterium]|nr:glycosyltransferase [Gemmatimonadales bacterium]
MSILVSIVIPTYNRDPLLRATADSVFAQSYRDWELLVIDHGSTDGSRRYLETLGDPRVRSLFLEHSGTVARVRNVGLLAARGSCIAFLDSDDLWHRDKLALQVAALEEHPECGWSYTGLAVVDERGLEIPSAGGCPEPSQRGWILEALINGSAVAATSAVVVRRTLLDTVGWFDESLPICEEIDLFTRLAEASQVTVVPGALTLCRRHPGNGPWPRLEILACRNRVYDRLIAGASSRRLRRVCRRSKRQFSLAHLRSLRVAGLYGEARRVLAMSFPYAGWRPAWWIGCLKTWLRPWLRRPTSGPTAGR